MGKDLEIWSMHGEQPAGIPVGIDLHWLLTVQLYLADAPISELSRGLIMRFLIHSPMKVFGVDHPEGTTLKFALTFRSGTDTITMVAWRAEPIQGTQTP